MNSNIDTVKKDLNIGVKGYPQVLSEICDYVLRKKEEYRQELTTFKGIIERIFIFFQEKCKEEIYWEEDFFLDLVSFYEQLVEKTKINGKKN